MTDTRLGRAAELVDDHGAPLTPDFYSYSWDAIADAQIHSCGTLMLDWPDGLQLECHPMWLRENACMEGGINIDARESEVIDPLDTPEAMQLSNVQLCDGELRLDFLPEGKPARFHPGWLRHVAEARHEQFAGIPEPQAWTTADFTAPLGHPGAEVLVDDAALHAALADIARYGLVRLEGCGTDNDFVQRLAERIGAIRDSNFGLVFHVDVDIEPGTLANTGMRLPAHADLPTREIPPGLQLLHCIENTVDGGYSTMADGLAVAEYLQNHEPDAFLALTTLEWVYASRSKLHDHRWKGKVIDAGDGRTPYTFRAFHPVRTFAAMPVAEMDRSYAAMRTFSTVANSDEFQLRYAFRAGDCVMFDNRRVLHGREAFEPVAGTRRHLRGTYLDSDELYSRLRVLHRRAAQPAAISS